MTSPLEERFREILKNVIVIPNDQFVHNSKDDQDMLVAALSTAAEEAVRDEKEAMRMEVVAIVQSTIINSEGYNKDWVRNTIVDSINAYCPPKYPDRIQELTSKERNDE